MPVFTLLFLALPLLLVFGLVAVVLGFVVSLLGFVIALPFRILRFTPFLLLVLGVVWLVKRFGHSPAHVTQ